MTSEMARPLFVFLRGRRIGTLLRHTAQSVEFRYDKDVSLDLTLSLSMPTIPGRRYSPDKASPFFNGLLPDSSDARLRMAQSFDSLDTSTFALLGKGGLDCAGAVQVWHEEELPVQGSDLVAVNEREVGVRLRSMGNGSFADLRYDDEHWSLSGAQRKIALRLEKDTWHVATGAAPSSHILKPGVFGIDGVSPGEQALVEHATMSAARSLGVDAAQTSYTEFDGHPAVVVQRFDRHRDSDGELVRMHQEDMCQALGVDPAHKYEDEGGPGVKHVADLLRSAVAVPAEARTDVHRFAQMVAFNYLCEGPDAHAKNYGLVHVLGGDVFLAPMYDAASGAMASRPDTRLRRFPKAAMSIGGQYRFAEAGQDQWEAFLQRLGLSKDSAVIHAVYDLAGHVPDAFADAIRGSDAPKRVRAHLASSGVVNRIAESAAAARAALEGMMTDAGHSGKPITEASVVCGIWVPEMRRRCSLVRGHKGWPLNGHG